MDGQKPCFTDPPVRVRDRRSIRWRDVLFGLALAGVLVAGSQAPEAKSAEPGAVRTVALGADTDWSPADWGCWPPAGLWRGFPAAGGAPAVPIGNAGDGRSG